MSWIAVKLCDMDLCTSLLSKFELYARSRVVHVVIAKIYQSNSVMFSWSQLIEIKYLDELVKGQLSSRTIFNLVIYELN